MSLATTSSNQLGVLHTMNTDILGELMGEPPSTLTFCVNILIIISIAYARIFPDSQNIHLRLFPNEYYMERSALWGLKEKQGLTAYFCESRNGLSVLADRCQWDSVELQRSLQDICSSTGESSSSLRTPVAFLARLRKRQTLSRIDESPDESDGHRLLVFSITHSEPADEVHLAKGDIILDGGNEWYQNTERRQRELKREQNVDYIGMGVSGGYQSARHGPSLSPGGDSAAIQRVMPLLEKVSAKAEDGSPCVTRIGPGGSGHYVKMVHNGIEQGMMGAVAEAWGLLRFNLGMKLDEIGEVFKQWSATAELKNTFLIDIGIDVCQKRDCSLGKVSASDNEGHVLSAIVDKVVQDADDTEGTGTWSVAGAARLHVSSPTIAASHFLRLASADRAARLKINENLKLPTALMAPRTTLDAEAKAQFVEDVRQSVIASFLSAFAQGLQLIARQSEKEGWDVPLASCLKIWRAGCIISSDGLSAVLAEVAADFDAGAGKANGSALGSATSHPKDASATIPAHTRLTKPLAATLPALRRTMMWSLERDARVPTLGATLEWVKYIGAPVLPTMFMEAQLDWFGAHSFEQWSSEAGIKGGIVQNGSKHYEWKPT